MKRYTIAWWENRITTPRINIWKTLYINFRSFRIQDAIKFPLLVYGSLKIYGIGKIQLNAPQITRGMVRIGQINYKTYTQTRIFNQGTIIFNGPCQIWGGAYLELSNQASLVFGEHVVIGENVRFLLQCSCTIGRYTRIAFDSSIMNTDFHYMINMENGEIKDCIAPIYIGCYNWIGHRTTIKKGTRTPDYTIVAAPNAMLNKDYTTITDPYPILGGSPAKQIAHGKRRIFKYDIEAQLRSYFKTNTTPYRINITEKAIKNLFD